MKKDKKRRKKNPEEKDGPKDPLLTVMTIKVEVAETKLVILRKEISALVTRLAELDEVGLTLGLPPLPPSASTAAVSLEDQPLQMATVEPKKKKKMKKVKASTTTTSATNASATATTNSITNSSTSSTTTATSTTSTTTPETTPPDAIKVGLLEKQQRVIYAVCYINVIAMCYINGVFYISWRDNVQYVVECHLIHLLEK